MANWCLLPEYVDKFKKALASYEINPEKLAAMTSEERRTFLERFVGKDNATNVNTLFEEKLLNKRRDQAYITWAEKVSGITTEARKELLDKITARKEERLKRTFNPEEEERFLQDLASTKIGANVSQEEAKSIFELSQKVKDSKAKLSVEEITKSNTKRSKGQLEYGLAEEILSRYVGELKGQSEKIHFKQQPIKYVTKLLWNAIPDLAQTLQTAYDNSLWGRQMITVLFNPRYSHIWAKNFLKSWEDIGIALKGNDPTLAIKADIRSRPNALNGKYAADPQGYGLGLKSEEVFSSALPAKIPVLKRLFKASEAAFNGGALRVRADLADLHIKAAENAGKNVMDKEFAKGLGNFVTAMTGRAAIQGEGFARSIFYAPRMYLADIHQLTAHMLDPRANAYVRKQAAINLASVLGAYSLLFVTAKMLDPESVDTEKHLGQIKLFRAWVDLTGGRASFVNLAAKMGQKVYDYQQGKMPKYGENTALEDLEDFAENKFSPKAAVIKDILTGSMYGGKRVTLENELVARFTPISGQDINKLLDDPKSTNDLALSILNELGTSVKVDQVYPTNWNSSSSKELFEFKKQLGQQQFDQANKEFNTRYDQWLSKTQAQDTFKRLSDEGKQSLTTKAKEQIKQDIFDKYRFKYKEPKETIQQKKEKTQLKTLLPK